MSVLNRIGLVLILNAVYMHITNSDVFTIRVLEGILFITGCPLLVWKNKEE